MAIVSVRKNVLLLRETEDMAILWVHKDVTLLRERWTWL